ncbi:hypothetical protein C1J03_10020 [Sulfitobacter sp. SK012]|uniref:hypothetical protein n=1 Tax=Sulfitobacter sp. SK012 TaxID=1389005 RepID=UPI000E0B7E6E|nr:hypothetical protein [Sulfitobacter sp. SK012]AXI46332.1 hypothetical protein C1J03_10020 [Sulfitobacter sp. SK012]
MTGEAVVGIELKRGSPKCGLYLDTVNNPAADQKMFLYQPSPAKWPKVMEIKTVKRKISPAFIAISWAIQEFTQLAPVILSLPQD